ncbi:transcription factor [Theileria orientalis strain Shintoku]|uniref:Transcription elongation factor SPT5 n=1 Tax=Theileria orientalis strain Shintoku TaxID=869250 RepID=J4C8H4_THEOR|nr:transcription factor [Theileria orientalis strain Shintoku]BAM40793.1 transcription factor [Theileria orientalis strain Shintoku]|eukprot:XP_009691094.1 transcription factor [Theileria orientalis strain Shintoku]
MAEESQQNDSLFKDDSLFAYDDIPADTKEVPRPKRSRKLKKRDPSKRRKFDVSAYLDTEAQVGDDEDDNYEYDHILPDESEEAERLAHRNHLKRLQEDSREGRRVGGTGYFENVIDKLDKRYQDQTFEEGEDVFSEVEEEGLEQTGALLPDYNDPKLWIVKTNRQTPDRNIAISLTNKFIKMQKEGKHMGIYSCFVPEGVTGYLYIEADNKQAVTEALAEFRNINLTTLKLVPMNEMANVFTSGNENLYFPNVGEYVRVKFGRYAGDLGQVYESDETNNTVTLKLIPRIDPELLGAGKMEEGGYEDQNESALLNQTVGHLKETKLRVNARQKSSQKFPKSFFDREAIELSGGLIEHGLIPGTFRYQGMSFLDSGHILVKFSAKRLACGENVNATLAELKEFNVDTTITEALEKISKAPNKVHLYKLGENIRVVKGELTSVVGKIVAIDKEEVEVQPEDKELPNFRINLNSVVKNLVEGDNVRAIGGSNEGQSGLVVLVNDKNRTALVFSPQTGQEFKCSLEHLSMIPKEGQGDSSHRVGGVNGFVVSDLIQTTTGHVGIITAVDRNSMLTLLTDTGEKVAVPASQIQCKRTSFGNTTKDFNNQAIEPRSRAMVVKGPYKHKGGQVLHVWRNSVFLTLENGEIICAASQDCLKSSGTIETTKTNNAPQGARIVRKNPLLGKTVKILQGRYKGLLGDIIHVEPTQFTILLKVKPKTVRYPKSDCVIMDNWHDVMRGHYSARENYVAYNRSLDPPYPQDARHHDHKDSRDYRDGDGYRDHRDGRDYRDDRDFRDGSSYRDHRDGRDYRDGREGRDGDSYRDYRDYRDDRDYRDGKEDPSQRESSRREGAHDVRRRLSEEGRGEEARGDTSRGIDDKEGTPTAPAPESEKAGAKLPNWCVCGVVVHVTGPGAYYGKRGVIGEVFENMADTTLQVLHVMVDEDYIAIAAESVEPVQPMSEGDRVLAHALGKDKFGLVTKVLEDALEVQLVEGARVTVRKEGAALVSSQ